MNYSLAYSDKDGKVFNVSLRATTPREAASDVERFLEDGATWVEVEMMNVNVPASLKPTGAESR